MSSKSQKDNTSPEGQLEKIRAYARQNDIDLIQEFTEIESGGVILARAYNPKSPIYKCLRMAERGEIQCIVADISDRWGRGDVIAVLEFMFEQAGAQVLYATPGRDKSTLQGFVVHQTDALVSGIERIRIRDRMMTGKMNAVRRGQLLVLGRPPWGFNVERQFDALGRRISTELIPIPSEQQTYLRMRDMVMLNGLSLRGVAKRLTDEGIPVPDARHGKRKANATWRASSVTKIMRNPVYGGRWYYGRIETKSVDTVKGRKSRQVRTRTLDEMPYVEVKGFTPWDEWLALQAKMDTHGDLFVKPTKNQYLLRGMIRCAQCGYMLCGVPVHHHSGTELYYRCRPSRHHAERKCASRSINAGDAERQVWDRVVAWLLDDVSIEAGRREMGDSPAVAGLEQALAGLERQKKDLHDEMRRTLRAYTRKLAGMTLALLEEEQARITDEMARIDKQIQTVRGEIAQAQQAQREMAQAGELKAKLADALRGGVDIPFEMKQKWLKALRLAGVWNADTETLSITCLIGQVEIPLKRYASRR